MRLGLHFEIADTPPLLWEKTTDKSEIYFNLPKSPKPPILDPKIADLRNLRFQNHQNQIPLFSSTRES